MLELWRSLATEKYLQTKTELECKDLRVYINNAQKVTVELDDKLDLSQKEFASKFKRTDELTVNLTANLAARDQSHAAELVLKAKELAEGSCPNFGVRA